MEIPADASTHCTCQLTTGHHDERVGSSQGVSPTGKRCARQDTMWLNLLAQHLPKNVTESRPPCLAPP